MPTPNLNRFITSKLSEDFAKKPSLIRYHELQAAFPKILIIFKHDGYYYGFNETAVALCYLFGCRYYQEKGMLVAKIGKIKFEEYIIAQKKMLGFCYLLDQDGELVFEKGTKLFHLQRPLLFYVENMVRIQNKRIASSYRNIPTTKHGNGWLNDAWTPGLPSSRMHRKK